MKQKLRKATHDGTLTIGNLEIPCYVLEDGTRILSPRGERPVKHHQWLTEDVGHPALAQHLHAVIGFMRASAKWDQFYRLLQRAFPKKGQNLELPLGD
jgi:hypothetical protein